MPVKSIVVRTLLFMVTLTAAAQSSCVASHTAGEWSPDAGDVVVRELRLLGIDYLEVVPVGTAANADLPMIVFFHGRGDRPHTPRGRFMGLEDPVRLIVPRAPSRYGFGFSWLPVSARDGESPELVEALRETGAHLANLIEGLQDRHRTLGSPIVMGFSQGGMLTYTLAVNHPEVVGAAFPLAGWLPPSLMPEQRREHTTYPMIRALHGADDPVLSASRTVRATRELEARGFAATVRTFEDVPHEMSDAMWQHLREHVAREVRKRFIVGRRSIGPFV